MGTRTSRLAHRVLRYGNQTFRRNNRYSWRWTGPDFSPHHENEIAQSEAKTGKTFANYWMHNGYVTIGEEEEKK